MNEFFLFLVLSATLCSTAIGQNSINCVPDKGIRRAKTVADLASEDDRGKANNNNYREVHYDTVGRVVLINNGRNGNIDRRVYQDGKLQLIVSTKKEVPNFHAAGEQDAFFTAPKKITDTAIVVNYHMNGEVYELRHANGDAQIFEYNDCQEEFNTIINSVGDTIHQYRSFFENGVVVKTIWTPFEPVKSDVVTSYYDYEFNEYGHWIKRKYPYHGEVVIEQRELIYY